MVLAADKLSKARELRLASGYHDPRVRSRKVQHYRHCLQVLQQQLPEFPLVSLLASELTHLTDTQPTRPPLAAAS